VNIFVTDLDPIDAARNLCDRHIVKMLTESCQMLANQFTPIELLMEVPRKETGGMRRWSYVNHPCSLWVKEKPDNAAWLIHHAGAMLIEYRARYHGNVNAFSQVKPFLQYCSSKIPERVFMNPSTTPFAICIPQHSACRRHSQFTEDPVNAYRLFYAVSKIFAEWKEDNAPQWYNELIQQKEVKLLRREAMKNI